MAFLLFQEVDQTASEESQLIRFTMIQKLLITKHIHIMFIYSNAPIKVNTVAVQNRYLGTICAFYIYKKNKLLSVPIQYHCIVTEYNIINFK